MRNYILLVSIILVYATSSVAQPKLGLKFSPLFTSNLINLDNDTIDVTSGKTSTRFSIGLIIDHPITDMYYASSGLIYLPKRINVNFEAENGGSAPVNSFESYDLNYLQIPVSLKFFTNEVALDLSIYFQIGVAAEIKIYEQKLQEEYDYISKFNLLDVSGLIGGGLEYRIGDNTALITGLSLQKGLINVVNQTFDNSDLIIRNKVICIDLALKF
ncbi:MAG: outer membrane beta-barrel protein [Flammeovirgaceae bacterium]|jgi:hypothetical protein|nr:outer membrane beta-barrel protein [Flammeovirgaceae bacterium]|tara:strand:- start:16527 stop:17171 length:645 start_codon:yes stop_codon:yes gene_type:complete